MNVCLFKMLLKVKLSSRITKPESPSFFKLIPLPENHQITIESICSVKINSMNCLDSFCLFRIEKFDLTGEQSGFIFV